MFVRSLSVFINVKTQLKHSISPISSDPLFMGEDVFYPSYSPHPSNLTLEPTQTPVRSWVPDVSRIRHYLTYFERTDRDQRAEKDQQMWGIDHVYTPYIPVPTTCESLFSTLVYDE